jgi:lupus La protein
MTSTAPATPAAATPTASPEVIQRQIEFYFSDSNFRKDTFLREAAASDPEAFVPIATLLTFNKLKAMTTDPQAIVNALATSETVEANEDGTKLRRKCPLPAIDNSKECSIYVKGFPLDDADVTLEAISEQFSPFGRVCMVRLRKDLHKNFKGSCFVEFDQPSAVDAAVAAANQDGVVTLSWKETPYLCVMKLGEWLERKAAKGGKGDKKTDKKKVEDTTGKRKRDEGDADEGEEETKQAEDGVVSFTPGLIIKVSGVPTSGNVFQLKDAFKPHGEVKYVEYTSGETTAFVRLGDSGSASSVLAALDAKEIKVGEGEEESVLEGTVLVGEEEVAYWTKIGQGSASKSSGGRGRGGRGGGRGRGRGGGRGKKSRR